MHLDGLDLNLLVVLDALFSEKSVTRTGERIHLSQSATSGALARLREYFKDDLLVPVGRNMVLTPLAEELARPLRDLLQQTETVIRRKPVFLPESSARRFRIVMSDYVAIVIMARALPEIQRQAPGISCRSCRCARARSNTATWTWSSCPNKFLRRIIPRNFSLKMSSCALPCAKNKLIKRSLSVSDYLSLSHVVVRFGDSRKCRHSKKHTWGGSPRSADRSGGDGIHTAVRNSSWERPASQRSSGGWPNFMRARCR
jgi:hypothetical protein